MFGVRSSSGDVLAIALDIRPLKKIRAFLNRFVFYFWAYGLLGTDLLLVIKEATHLDQVPQYNFYFF